MCAHTVRLDLTTRGIPLDTSWKTLCTAGRAGEGLRADWRTQITGLQRSSPFQYIRFHGLFHDDMMVYREQDGVPVFNWMYLDELFDFLRSVKLKPFIELGFMPDALKSGDATCFWWKGNITPPNRMERWQLLVSELIRHCIRRYGLSEVRTWYFEVWNEPNLFEFFWHATQEEYFALYEATVTTIKGIDASLRVGGPSSSNFAHGEAPWVRDFLAFCRDRQLPVDFVSFHPYPNKWPTNEDGKRVLVYRGPEALASDLEWMRTVLPEYGYPNAELHITEWNSSFINRDLVHDTMYMGTFILHNVLQSIGRTNSLGYWTFTDIFEETRVGDTTFHGGFGLITVEGIRKPSFWAYWYLEQLGPELIGQGSSWIATRDETRVTLLAWNYAHYTDSFAGGDSSSLTHHTRYDVFEEVEPQTIEPSLDLPDHQRIVRATLWEMNREAGSAFDEWIRIGAPQPLDAAVRDYLMRASGPQPSVVAESDLTDRRLPAIEIPAHGIAMYVIDLGSTKR